MLPWAINGLPGDNDARPSLEAPQLVQQPLTGIGGGETIREIHQDTPFSMVALTATDLTGTSARVRAKKADGSWGPWYEAEALEGVGPEGSGPRGTDPVFVGRTTTVQIAITRPADAAPTGPTATAEPDRAGARIRASQRRAAVRPEHQRRADQPAAGAGRQLAAAQRSHSTRCCHPHIINRAQWGADEAMRCGNPQYDKRNPGRHRPPHRWQQRIRPAGFGRASSGRSTSTTPAPWAGATSPITRWSTSTARSSRAGQAAWTNRSRARTPVDSTATPGGWR